jgi:hypothetical protein
MATRTELLNHGQDGTVTLVERPLSWQHLGLMYTASGYGAKIPIGYVVNYKNRIRRVYCTIFSNAGTCWILVNGQKMIVGS